MIYKYKTIFIIYQIILLFFLAAQWPYGNCTGICNTRCPGCSPNILCGSCQSSFLSACAGDLLRTFKRFCCAHLRLYVIRMPHKFRGSARCRGFREIKNPRTKSPRVSTITTYFLYNIFINSLNSVVNRFE